MVSVYFLLKKIKKVFKESLIKKYQRNKISKNVSNKRNFQTNNYPTISRTINKRLRAM